MKTFIVEVPVYLSLRINAPAANDDPAHLAQLGLDYVADAIGRGKDMLLKWPLPGGATVVTQRMELLDKDEDRTPDVYDATRTLLLNPPGEAPPFYGLCAEWAFRS